MKVFAATVLSLSLLAATTPAMAFGAPANAPAPKQPAAKPVAVAQTQDTQPEVTNNTGNAQDIARKRRNRKIVIGLITAGVIVGVIAASGSSNSGTTGTTVP